MSDTNADFQILDLDDPTSSFLALPERVPCVRAEVTGRGRTKLTRAAHKTSICRQG